MQIKLSDHFTYSRLYRFTLPSIIMMIFTSVYGVIDGLFISNFVGKEPFAAINLIFPVIMLIGTVGFMMGAGGTAIVSKTLGERDGERANKYFSFIVYVTIVMGTALALLAFVFMKPLATLVGAKGNTFKYCVEYGRIVVAAMPFFMIQNLFQSFFIAAEKPKLGLWVTVAAGVTNIVLDALFVAVFEWGLAGAAIATSLSQVTGAVIPVFYFARKNTSLLRLVKTKFYGNVLLRSITNGSSELVSNSAASLVTMLYNYQLMKFAEEDGVAAYGVIMYVSFIFVAIFIGYSIGSAPIVGYNYGAKNSPELKNVFKKSTVTLLGAGVVMMAVSFIFAKPLSMIFVSYDETLLEITTRGMQIYSFSFIFAGFGIFGSSFFTALNNGPVSAIISSLRTLVYQVISILLLPIVFGLDGIWFSIVVAEALSFVTTWIFVIAKRKKYQYL